MDSSIVDDEDARPAPPSATSNCGRYCWEFAENPAWRLPRGACEGPDVGEATTNMCSISVTIPGSVVGYARAPLPFEFSVSSTVPLSEELVAEPPGSSSGLWH